MESATLIRPRPGVGLPARLRAVSAPLLTRGAFLLRCAGVAIRHVVYPTARMSDATHDQRRARMAGGAPTAGGGILYTATLVHPRSIAHLVASESR